MTQIDRDDPSLHVMRSACLKVMEDGTAPAAVRVQAASALLLAYQMADEYRREMEHLSGARGVTTAK